MISKIENHPEYSVIGATKKPIAIQTMQFDGTPECANQIVVWVTLNKGRAEYLSDRNTIRIYTLEGNMLARQGWWVIKGVAGEFYPCDPTIFKATYDIQGKIS